LQSGNRLHYPLRSKVLSATIRQQWSKGKEEILVRAERFPRRDAVGSPKDSARNPNHRIDKPRRKPRFQQSSGFALANMVIVVIRSIAQ